MNIFILVVGAAILVLGLIIFQLRMFGKKHPNAEMLMRLYQMITSKT
jgi:hypothetical protein